jgi:hypothetical protein
MRGRTGPLICLVVVAAASFWSIEPRLHHEFPSTVDDWSAIEKAPAQLRGVLRLGVPEGTRYRPGFVMWNALQWHTLGAPKHFLGPLLWDIARWAVLVVGVTLLTLLLVGRPRGPRDGRWLLAIGVPLVAITAPAIAIDIARYGPQEPLLVGCMALGAVLLVRAIERLLAGEHAGPGVLSALSAGLVLWTFGVLQKETSICVLLLAPFLWPTLRDQRGRWALLDERRRRAIGLVTAGILLPFLPMVVRTTQLALTGDRLYEDPSASNRFSTRLSDQLSQAAGVLHTELPTIVVVAAVVLLAAVLLRVGVDWISVGLLVVAVGFVAFAAHAGVVTSRYYIPTIALAALVLARSAVRLGHMAVLLVGVSLIGGGLFTAHDAHTWVWRWVNGERAQEALVREAAARAAAGCTVAVVGTNVEFVVALPVLMPLARERPRGCVEGERFLARLDSGAPGSTPPDNPVLLACRPEQEPVWTSSVGELYRCTA